MEKQLNMVVMPGGSLHLEWIETSDKIDKYQTTLQDDIYKRFEEAPYSSLLFLGFSNKSIPISISLNYWREFAGLFAHKLSLTPELETVRHKAELILEEDEIIEILDRTPIMTGAEYINKELIESVWSGLRDRFVEEIKSYEGTVEEYIRTLSPDVHIAGRVYFHLVENKKENHPFAFLATYSTRLDKKGTSKHLPLKTAIKEYGENSEKLLELLATVYLAGKESPMINNLLESGELFQPLAWTADEAFVFLKENLLYEKSGIICRIPNWWKSTTSRVSFNITIGTKEPSYVGMETLLDFHPHMMLGDTPISESEARELLQEAEGLVFIKNKWITVDHEKLKQSLDAYEKAMKLVDEEGLSLKDAMRLQLNPKNALNIKDIEDDIGVTNGEWFDAVLKKLRNPDLIKTVKPDNRFKAELRHYQQKGINWLSFLHSLQFGACLADDMGLGKTIQLLAFLNVLKLNKDTKASLLIIPASLIPNWIDEIEKFFPSLKYFAAHPGAQSNKKVTEMDQKTLDKYDLIITTYALSQRYEWLGKYSWNYVILDEAQAIKNSGTKQTKAVKSFKAYNRIAMTGTPIENKLSDLWSLFDFLNPGLLGTAKEFTDFSKELNDNPDGFTRLRKLISPYILRRLKIDKNVITDLPDKVEVKTYSLLSKKQILLYGNYVDKINSMLDDPATEGIQRRGLILSSIIKFKQLCNHPDQYKGSGDYLEKDSGKFQRLREICETILEKREKVLVFTQFKEMTEPLANHLKDIFGKEGLVLHGSTPVGKRKQLIKEFQTADYIPFMVLSLKAGGVGLNLTEANHVIHFDRWWNPAVENQATDRAFRIGQKKNVMVHKFLTKGTIEEKIDAMLIDKLELSQNIIHDMGQAMITEMDNKQLKELFKLTL